MIPGTLNYRFATVISLLIFIITNNDFVFADNWGVAEIKASRKYLLSPALEKRPSKASLKDIFLIVDHQKQLIHVFDGEKLKKIHQFTLQSQSKGQPVLDSTQRYAYLLTEDGWVNKFDKLLLNVVAKIKVGIKTSNIAISHDDKYLVAANIEPQSLVILNSSDLSLAKLMPAIDKQGKSSPVSAVHTAASFNSFIASLKNSKELWEINYQNPPPADFGEWVHDYRKDSGEATIKRFPVRHIRLPAPIEDFFFDHDSANLVCIATKGKAQVVDLDLARKVATLPVAGIPHSSSGIIWKEDKKMQVAMIDAKDKSVVVIDASTWKISKKTSINSIGLIIPDPYQSSTIWVSILSGKNRGDIQIFDRSSLKIIKTLHPGQRNASSPGGFVQHGALAFIGSRNILNFYDTRTYKTVKQIAISDKKFQPTNNP